MRTELLTAVRFLTRVPVPEPGPIDAGHHGRSVLFYPLVGLMLGLVLWAGAALLAPAPAVLGASVLLIVWVWGTGGLHLDGLADAADAWVGGIGDRSRTLDIMKDPAVGATGTIALILVLMVKWAALTSLIATDPAVLVWVPALARAQLLLLLLTTPYAGRAGIGASLAAALPRRGAWVAGALTILACTLTLGSDAWVLAATCILVFALWRRAMMRRLGGFTGDTAGALVELTEALGLVAVALARAY